MKKFIFILMLVLCLSANAISINAHAGEPFLEDIVKTMHLAEQGNAQAQYTLDLLYAKGTGVAQDYLKIKDWSENLLFVKSAFYINLLTT